ncbi:hypothetical protein SAMN05421776_107270 [Nocardia farcinica]|uniref:Uncharacterized protein n=1 Tax=Nocardia farcinica TaxID=37329 RepID=A0A0H5NYA0_NOCFR|nr:hypothetical protein CJ469_05253 [Nocardia farcinica]PFX07128.1 hypothetical protein CJ468_03966 [Nocardia farcinica]CRY80462.1 Uncharacterised protein [Nocardia farcinica]SIT28531.1 hypothetical protein SAMN05421776_107270 [Nocardia farcinica]SUE31172.1 Uncharacterised protein [Nocardia farcinica]
MSERLPSLPVRTPATRPTYLYRFGCRSLHLLERVAAGLRALDDHYPPAQCRTGGPIRSQAHACLVMDRHVAHRCPRFAEAAAYVAEVET